MSEQGSSHLDKSSPDSQNHTCPHHGDLGGSCHPQKKVDYLYYGSLGIVAVAYGAHLLGAFFNSLSIQHFNHQVFLLMNDMWWGIAVSILAVGILNKIPREMVMTYFTGKTRVTSLVRATLAGTLFDLCNHGVLILAMKIYERGASLGQTMAFLISSPWNSFSLTMIMFTLIGAKLTFLFLGLSLVIAMISGWIFDELVEKKVLPPNPHAFRGADSDKVHVSFEFTVSYFLSIIVSGFKESKMILKWIFIGTILSAFVGVFMSPEVFANYFGNSLKGLFMTLIAATGLEVCSEGSVPLAADLVRVAHAPGNAFIFLMAGVATDLTEIFAVRETMKSWKVALFLPLITVPQIIIFGILINLWL